MEHNPRPRKYWAQRHGAESGRLRLEEACRLYLSFIGGLVEQGYFQEWFGYECVDAGEVPGLAGPDASAFVFRRTRLQQVWPPSDAWLKWDELHLLTAIEFFYDHVSKPIDGRFHSWSNCGWHYNTFDRQEGQAVYREEVNAILTDLADGFDLSASGEVNHRSPEGLADLLAIQIPIGTAAGVRQTIDDAVRKFRRATSTPSDRRDAVRDLADVLELVRPRLKEVMAEPDEAALFNIANNFAVRHMNQRQRTQYDREVWLPWMFYFFLATVHAVLRLLEKRVGASVAEALAEPDQEGPAADQGAELPPWL